MRKIYRFQKIDSTNAEAIRRAREGEPEGAVFVADQQVEGRGREGRAWESPPGKNLYVSFLLRPRVTPEQALGMTQVVAMVVKKTLLKTVDFSFVPAGPDGRQLFELRPKRTVSKGRPAATLQKQGENRQSLQKGIFTIKPPNDILLNGKKVAGILCEMGSAGAKTNWVVCGIGINVNSEAGDFSPAVWKTATSLKITLGRNFDREEILQRLIKGMEGWYEKFTRH